MYYSNPFTQVVPHTSRKSGKKMGQSCSSTTTATPENAAPQASDKIKENGECYDVLAVHEVRATFNSINHQSCRFMTADCPDRCGHAKDVANFTVDEYIHYDKPGQYGDEKQSTIHYAVGDHDPRSDSYQHAELDEKVKALKEGDKVVIRYEHRYMKDADGSQWPVRPFTKIEKA